MESKIDINQINKTIEKIRSEVDNIDSKIKELTNKIEELGNYWEGADYTSYKNIMIDNQIYEINKLKDILGEYLKYLSDIPGVYLTMDSFYNNK